MNALVQRIQLSACILQIALLNHHFTYISVLRYICSCRLFMKTEVTKGISELPGPLPFLLPKYLFLASSSSWDKVVQNRYSPKYYQDLLYCMVQNLEKHFNKFALLPNFVLHCIVIYRLVYFSKWVIMMGYPCPFPIVAGSYGCSSILSCKMLTLTSSTTWQNHWYPPQSDNS